VNDRQDAGASPSSADLRALALQCLEEGGQAALESFLGGYPGRSGELREGLAALSGVGFLGEVDPQRPESAEIPKTLGEFRLLERLGSGGMGVVYLAEQPSLKRRVALKLIRPEHLYFPRARERSRREIEAVAGLEHPSIVRVYAAGVEAGLPYFTMERVHGVSLAELLQALRSHEPSNLSGRVVREELARLTGSDPGTEVQIGLFVYRKVACVNITVQVIVKRFVYG
jgi:hypothetical protein